MDNVVTMGRQAMNRRILLRAGIAGGLATAGVGVAVGRAEAAPAVDVEPALRDWRPVGLTIVEALDTLFFMGLDRELADGVAWIRDHLDFRTVTQPVQIFETNIRMVGGLLSGYLCTGERVLLRKARDIADVLLPAFDRSPTGAPYRFVVPSTGETSGTQNVLAEIGTIVAEFGTLSRLVGDDRYYNAA